MAAVAEVICDHIKIEINKPDVVAACLLHDMGNIVKFDFNQTKKFINQDLDLGFWQKVKDKFIEKYGTGSHNVTMKIVNELKVKPRIGELVDCVGFEQGQANEQAADFGKKICAYSDMRVGPRGAIPLEERMADLRVRYKNHPEGAQAREVFEQALRRIEQQIFEHCNIKPGDITDEAVAKIIGNLKSFDI